MSSLKTKSINFNGKRMWVYVVESIKDKIKGATIFEEPPKNINGMLFVGYNFILKNIWMKGMKFPLNIYFLDENMNIIKSYENVQPCNKFLGIGCEKYTCDRKYAHVLELWR